MTGILLCAFIAVLVFRGWRLGPVPVATVAPVVPVAPMAATTVPSAIAQMFLILKTQDLNAAVFDCPSVQPTTREGMEPDAYLDWTLSHPLSNGAPLAKPQAAK